ncbi:hypothetical protein [Brevundimonas sp.]|uniref:hypothetical protein n=1 Tax=Brevundimonas sp. TaxID=1871086 RepID=UPI003D0AE275
MSFREKSAWAQFLILGYLWGRYFWWFGEQVLVRGSLTEQGFSIYAGTWFGMAVFGSVVVSGVAALARRFSTPAAERGLHDEREALADLRATRWAFTTTTLLLVCIAFSAFWFGNFYTGNMEGPTPDPGRMADWPTMLTVANGMVLMANAVWAAVIFGMLVRYAGLINLLRHSR